MRFQWKIQFFKIFEIRCQKLENLVPEMTTVPSWSLSNDNNPGNGRLLRVMCHVLFSDILLSIISIWVIGSFLLFLQINRQIGSCRRCKRTETIGILVTIICTSALLLQHLYYLLGVCVVTVACQYVHCSLIGKSTFDSSLTCHQNLQDTFFFT